MKKLAKIFCDLFTGVNSDHYELARVLTALAFVAVNGLAIYKISQGLDVKVKDLAEANAILFAASAVFIGGKDYARAKAIETAGADA